MMQIQTNNFQSHNYIVIIIIISLPIILYHPYNCTTIIILLTDILFHSYNCTIIIISLIVILFHHYNGTYIMELGPYTQNHFTILYNHTDNSIMKFVLISSFACRAQRVLLKLSYLYCLSTILFPSIYICNFGPACKIISQILYNHTDNSIMEFVL